MTRLKTDLPLLPDEEMDQLVEGILEKTHYRDVKALRQKLDERQWHDARNHDKKV